MKQSTATPARDYSGFFLGAVLLGIIVMVLGLTMAAARSAPADCLIEQQQRSECYLRHSPTLARVYHDGYISPPREPFHRD
jgi:hypothetical protein